MDITISDIVASLRRRGFVPDLPPVTCDIDSVEEQFFAVAEELGEVARHLRRVRQGREVLDVAKLQDEIADVVVSSTNMLYRACGQATDITVARKMAEDERRGWLHSGLSREQYEARQRGAT